MNGNDFAIVSASMTCAEAIVMELPFIAVKVVANQQNTFDFCKKNKIMAIEPSEITDLSHYVKKMSTPVFYQKYLNHIKTIKKDKFQLDNHRIHELIITRKNH